jgi:hypothetical protein
MALSYSRNAKLYISTSQTIQASGGEPGVLDSNTWEVPVLDGFSFSANTATQEIEISEAGAAPVRGQQVFTTAIEPVDWSIQAYMRPRFDTVDSTVDAVERILWEALAAPPASSIGTAADGGASGATTRQASASGGMAVDFDNSNTNELLQLSFLFNLGTAAAPVWYHIDGVVVDTAEVDFAIDAIASITWTGFGTNVIEVTDSGDLSQLDNSTGMLSNPGDMQDTSFPSGTVSLIGASGQDGIGGNTYTVALTGGTLTIANNITFLTPEALGVVNNPCGHFTGQRTVNGNITAYLKTGGSNDTGDLLNHLITYSNGSTGADPTKFDMTSSFPI